MREHTRFSSLEAMCEAVGIISTEQFAPDARWDAHVTATTDCPSWDARVIAATAGHMVRRIQGER